MNGTAIKIILLIFVIITWGYSWVLMKIGLDYMGPFTFSAWRCGVGGLVMIPILYYKKIPIPSWNKIPDYFAVGIFQTTGMFAFLLYGMQFVTAGKSSVLLYTMSIWTALLVHFYIGHKLTTSKWIGVLIGGAGIVSILGWDTVANQSTKILFGETLIIIGAVCWAVANIWVKKRMKDENIYMVCGMQLIIGTVGLVLLAIPTDGIMNVEWTAQSVYIVLFTGIVASAIDFTIWFYLIKTLDINITTFSSMLVPVSGLLFDWAMLGNRLDAGVIVGGVLILAGIYQVSKKKSVP